MAKTLLINHLGAVSKWVFLPCDDTVALTFAGTFLDGKYEAYAKTGEAGSDKGITTYNDVTVMIKDTAGRSTYISFPAKATKSDTEILTALAGKTFNTVKADQIAITKMISRSVGA